MAIKRDREEGDFFVLLSHVGPKKVAKATTPPHSFPGRVFQCKSCDRQFSSFQALGGHRASHKKPRLSPDGDLELWPLSKPKTHECSICGQEFAIGQALGGHMRRHRSTGAGGGEFAAATSPSTSQSLVVMKKSNSGRVLCLDLDLNLTPLENDLKFRYGRTTLQCFL